MTACYRAGQWVWFLCGSACVYVDKSSSAINANILQLHTQVTACNERIDHLVCEVSKQRGQLAGARLLMRGEQQPKQLHSQGQQGQQQLLEAGEGADGGEAAAAAACRAAVPNISLPQVATPTVTARAIVQVRTEAALSAVPKPQSILSCIEQQLFNLYIARLFYSDHSADSAAAFTSFKGQIGLWLQDANGHVCSDMQQRSAGAKQELVVVLQAQPFSISHFYAKAATHQRAGLLTWADTQALCVEHRGQPVQQQPVLVQQQPVLVHQQPVLVQQQQPPPPPVQQPAQQRGMTMVPRKQPMVLPKKIKIRLNRERVLSEGQQQQPGQDQQVQQQPMPVEQAHKRSREEQHMASAKRQHLAL
jgi:hypothetical protein